MPVRFVMFPHEEMLLPVYERLLGCKERGAARVLRALLYHQDLSRLPPWFEGMARVPFSGSRSKTIRLMIPDGSEEPALSYLHEQLATLSQQERSVRIKTLIYRMLMSSHAATFDAGAVHATEQPTPASENKNHPLLSGPVAKTDAKQDAKTGILKKSASIYKM